VNIDRRAMEKTMSDIHSLLAKQDFADIDEVNRFLAGLMADGDGIPTRQAATPLEEAQDLMYEAWEAIGARRAQLARKALAISPDCADAYVLLAEQKARTVEEARDFFAQGVAAGERALGTEVFKEDEGYFWGVIETRPYMRARAGLARCLWELGEREAAIGHYKEMLRLNPGDNQGMRYVLLSCLLAMGRDDDAGALLAEHEDEGTAAWLYDYALWAFRREGDGPESRRRLKEASKQNLHVSAYLLGRKRLPARLPDFVGFGDENEAVAYAADALANWQATDGALSWLAGAK
jgi:tetratricopeptide (TPR) repeat protein